MRLAIYHIYSCFFFNFLNIIYLIFDEYDYNGGSISNEKIYSYYPYFVIVVTSLTTVSAANTKEDWHGIIDPQLEEIYNAVLNQDFDEARKILSNVRGDIYDCARYLAEIGEYKNGDILNVLNIVSRAVLKKADDAPKQVTIARCLLAKVLLDSSPDFCSDSPEESVSDDSGNTYPFPGGSDHS